MASSRVLNILGCPEGGGGAGGGVVADGGADVVGGGLGRAREEQ